MNPSELSKLAAEVERVLGLLLEEAVALLRNFDTLAPGDFEETTQKREKILEQFHELDGRITLLRKLLGDDELSEFEEYRQSRDAAIGKILETDSLVIALAKEQLSVIKEDLSSLTKGKTALHAYERGSMTHPRSLNDTV